MNDIFFFWLVTGLIAIYPARRLVKYWDSRRCLIDFKRLEGKREDKTRFKNSIIVLQRQK